MPGVRQRAVPSPPPAPSPPSVLYCTMATLAHPRPPFHPSSSSSFRPVSPTYSQRSSTPASAVSDFQGAPDRIVSKKDLRASLGAYDELITAGRAYRAALSSASQASSNFALSIERCARLKGVSSDSSSALLAASGLHYMIANQEQVLGDTLRTTFEQPLALQLESYRKNVLERTLSYERAQTDLSRQIRSTEAENMRVGRRRQRDLSSFRAALSLLQSQVDELDRLKSEYYTSVLSSEEETWDFVLSKVAHVVRASLDIYERVSAKGTDSALEPMLTANPDPFNAYGQPQGEDKMFSILTPLGMLSPALGGQGFGSNAQGGLDKPDWGEPSGGANGTATATAERERQSQQRRSTGAGALPPIAETRSVTSTERAPSPSTSRTPTPTPQPHALPAAETWTEPGTGIGAGRAGTGGIETRTAHPSHLPAPFPAVLTPPAVEGEPTENEMGGNPYFPSVPGLRGGAHIGRENARRTGDADVSDVSEGDPGEGEGDGEGMLGPGDVGDMSDVADLGRGEVGLGLGEESIMQERAPWEGARSPTQEVR
ncbi:hypothetical protein CALVIDRAFT_540269 [Calocera viscosa TUFC12733]|uniref:IMD domain-containing protein n=1 Tax=Calocera viscosa (strain TUFC12733) TaxID=1330018 RepID=A0A167J6F5_CALVF|nr:hypothetical protein CALVIDRAFT_540269 [Calocera viscosa TUFC12733]